MSRTPIVAAMLVVAILLGAAMLPGENPVVAADEPTPGIATPTVAVAEPFPEDIPIDGASIGAPDAPVTVVVWSDYTCPGCKRFALESLPRLVTEFVVPGDVRLVYRDYSFRGPGAMRAAEAAACAADQDSFWPYHRTLFLNQEGPVDGFGHDRLQEMARALALDATAFDNCLRAGEMRGAVERSIEEARAQGIDSVPTVFVNGVEIVYWNDPAIVRDEVERALAAAVATPHPAPSAVATPPLAIATPAPLVGMELIFDARPYDRSPLDPETALAIRASLQRRMKSLGVSGGIWRRPGDQILVRIDATDDPARVVHVLATPARLEIIDPQGAYLPPGTTVATTLGPSADTAPAGGPVYETIVSGADLRDVYVVTGADGVTPAIGFDLQGDGPSRLHWHTSTHVGQPMSIVIDKQVVSSPVINGAISGQGIIEGVPPEEVPGLVAVLKAGSLPVPIMLVESRVIPARSSETDG
jgi:protein-disulfide isomerase